MFNSVNANLWIILIFVGFDVGKNTFDASLMSSDEKELFHNSFDNTPEGI